MATQNLNLALQPSILDIDNTTSHIATLLAAQTNDQERCSLTEKIIIELINKNKEQRDLLENNEKLLKEQKDLLKTIDNGRKKLLNELEGNDKLLQEQEDLLHERDQLLAMSARQLGKIQALEKQLQAVEGHPRAINIKQTPAFIQIPDTKANFKHFERIEIAKKYSDLQNSHPYNTKLLKSNERAELVDRLTTARAEYPVKNYKDMRKTLHWLQQKLHTNSLHACANILDSKNEENELYKEWHTYWITPTEDDKTAIGAKIQSITILAEILRNIFSKDNPVMALKFHHAYAKIPEDILGVYQYQIIKDQFPQAMLDVIVRDIVRVLMFSLQAPRYTTFDGWYRSFMQKIENLNLLYGQITWEQVYLAMVLWALQLMGSMYQLLRQHMKFRLPSDTKELLKEPNETLDKIITMITQWDTSTMSHQNQKEQQEKTDNKQIVLNIMCNMLDLPLQDDTSTDETCSYCEKPHHTREQCWLRKSDEDLKEKVKILIPSLKKIYKAQEEILQQRGLKTHQEKVMRSTLHTLQGMTIGGNRIKNLMDTDRYHQGERSKSKENAPARIQPRNLQVRGRVPEPQTTQDQEDQEYEEEDQGYQDLRSTYDYNRDCQGHDDYQDGSHEELQDEEEDGDTNDDEFDRHDQQAEEEDDIYSQEHQDYDADEYYETDQDDRQVQDNDQQVANIEQKVEIDEGDDLYHHQDDQESDRDGNESYKQDDQDDQEENDNNCTSAGEEYEEITPVD
jgi:hypothetical protein